MDHPAERRSVSRRVASSLLVAQVLLAGIGVGAWRWAEASPPPASVLADDGSLPAGAMPTLEGGLAIAEAQARAWQEDAEPLNATMQVDWPWERPPPGTASDLPAGGWLVYVFIAPWEPRTEDIEAASLTVLIDRLTGAVLPQEPVGWARAPAGDAPRPTARVTSVEAVLLAEAAGGTDFRRACPVHRHLTRASLVATGPWPPHWFVSYRDERTPARHGLAVRIDARTAEVLAVEADGEPCDDAALVPGQAPTRLEGLVA